MASPTFKFLGAGPHYKSTIPFSNEFVLKHGFPNAGADQHHSSGQRNLATERRARALTTQQVPGPIRHTVTDATTPAQARQRIANPAVRATQPTPLQQQTRASYLQRLSIALTGSLAAVGALDLLFNLAYAGETRPDYTLGPATDASNQTWWLNFSADWGNLGLSTIEGGFGAVVILGGLGLVTYQGYRYFRPAPQTPEKPSIDKVRFTSRLGDAIRILRGDEPIHFQTHAEQTVRGRLAAAREALSQKEAAIQAGQATRATLEESIARHGREKAELTIERDTARTTNERLGREKDELTRQTAGLAARVRDLEDRLPANVKVEANLDFGISITLANLAKAHIKQYGPDNLVEKLERQFEGLGKVNADMMTIAQLNQRSSPADVAAAITIEFDEEARRFIAEHGMPAFIEQLKKRTDNYVEIKVLLTSDQAKAYEAALAAKAKTRSDVSGGTEKLDLDDASKVHGIPGLVENLLSHLADLSSSTKQAGQTDIHSSVEMAGPQLQKLVTQFFTPEDSAAIQNPREHLREIQTSLEEIEQILEQMDDTILPRIAKSKDSLRKYLNDLIQGIKDHVATAQHYLVLLANLEFLERELYTVTESLEANDSLNDQAFRSVSAALANLREAKATINTDEPAQLLADRTLANSKIVSNAIQKFSEVQQQLATFNSDHEPINEDIRRFLERVDEQKQGLEFGTIREIHTAPSTTSDGDDQDDDDDDVDAPHTDSSANAEAAPTEAISLLQHASLPDLDDILSTDSDRAATDQVDIGDPESTADDGHTQVDERDSAEIRMDGILRDMPTLVSPAARAAEMEAKTSPAGAQTIDEIARAADEALDPDDPDSDKWIVQSFDDAENTRGTGEYTGMTERVETDPHLGAALGVDADIDLDEGLELDTGDFAPDSEAHDLTDAATEADEAEPATAATEAATVLSAAPDLDANIDVGDIEDVEEELEALASDDEDVDGSADTGTVLRFGAAPGLDDDILEIDIPAEEGDVEREDDEVIVVSSETDAGVDAETILTDAATEADDDEADAADAATFIAAAPALDADVEPDTDETPIPELDLDPDSQIRTAPAIPANRELDEITGEEVMEAITDPSPLSPEDVAQRFEEAEDVVNEADVDVEDADVISLAPPEAVAVYTEVLERYYGGQAITPKEAADFQERLDEADLLAAGKSMEPHTDDDIRQARSHIEDILRVEAERVAAEEEAARLAAEEAQRAAEAKAARLAEAQAEMATIREGINKSSWDDIEAKLNDFKAKYSLDLADERVYKSFVAEITQEIQKKARSMIGIGLSLIRQEEPNIASKTDKVDIQEHHDEITQTFGAVFRSPYDAGNRDSRIAKLESYLEQLNARIEEIEAEEARAIEEAHRAAEAEAARAAAAAEAARLAEEAQRAAAAEEAKRVEANSKLVEAKDLLQSLIAGENLNVKTAQDVLNAMGNFADQYYKDEQDQDSHAYFRSHIVPTLRAIAGPSTTQALSVGLLRAKITSVTHQMVYLDLAEDPNLESYQYPKDKEQINSALNQLKGLPRSLQRTVRDETQTIEHIQAITRSLQDKILEAAKVEMDYVREQSIQNDIPWDTLGVLLTEARNKYGEQCAGHQDYDRFVAEMQTAVADKAKTLINEALLVVNGFLEVSNTLNHLNDIAELDKVEANFTRDYNEVIHSPYDPDNRDARIAKYDEFVEAIRARKAEIEVSQSAAERAPTEVPPPPRAADGERRSRRGSPPRPSGPPRPEQLYRAPGAAGKQGGRSLFKPVGSARPTATPPASTGEPITDWVRRQHITTPPADGGAAIVRGRGSHPLVEVDDDGHPIERPKADTGRDVATPAGARGRSIDTLDPARARKPETPATDPRAEVPTQPPAAVRARAADIPESAGIRVGTTIKQDLFSDLRNGHGQIELQSFVYIGGHAFAVTQTPAALDFLNKRIFKNFGGTFQPTQSNFENVYGNLIEALTSDEEDPFLSQYPKEARPYVGLALLQVGLQTTGTTYTEILTHYTKPVIVFFGRGTQRPSRAPKEVTMYDIQEGMRAKQVQRQRVQTNDVHPGEDINHLLILNRGASKIADTLSHIVALNNSQAELRRVISNRTRSTTATTDWSFIESLKSMTATLLEFYNYFDKMEPYWKDHFKVIIRFLHKAHDDLKNYLTKLEALRRILPKIEERNRRLVAQRGVEERTAERWHSEYVSNKWEDIFNLVGSDYEKQMLGNYQLRVTGSLERRR